MDDIELKNTIARSIVKFRKQANMTQLELAQKLNYSDKAASKWERAESMPDIVVLKHIADLFRIKIDDLTEETSTSKIHIGITVEKQIIIPIIVCFAVLLLSTVAFSFFQMFSIHIKNAWLCFIYAIPASALSLALFGLFWKKLLYSTITCSIFVWSLALALHLSLSLPNSYTFYIIAIPLQIIIILIYILSKIGRNRKRRVKDSEICDTNENESK